MLSDLICFFFFKQKTAYEMRIGDWSSDVCSSDLSATGIPVRGGRLCRPPHQTPAKRQPDHGGKHPFYITSFDAFTRADHSRNLPSASAAYGGNARDGELPPLCNVVCGGSPWGGQRYGGVLAPSRRAPPGDRTAGR